MLAILVALVAHLTAPRTHLRLIQEFCSVPHVVVDLAAIRFAIQSSKR